jgi:hypothetical protein
VTRGAYRGDESEDGHGPLHVDGEQQIATRLEVAEIKEFFSLADG